MADNQVSQPKLRAVPCSITKAKEIVDGWHRHHGSSTSALFAAAVADEDGIARRIGAALGYARMVTYTRADEPGASLRAAGLKDEGPIRARSWNMPGRPRVDKTEIIQRRRWSLELGSAPESVTWPDPPPPQVETLFDALEAVTL